MDSILIIHRFGICKFAYSLNFICNPKIKRYVQSSEKLSPLTCTFPAKVEEGGGVLSCFSSHPINRASFFF